MGIRETLARKPAAAVAFGSSVVLIGLGLLLYSGVRPRGASAPSGLAFYSEDDGVSWFPDSADNLSPFAHNGKQAYRVHVWKCSHGKSFVSHLERLPPAGIKRLQELKTSPRPNNMSGPAPEAEAQMLRRAVEIKKPRTGEAGWTRLGTPEAEKILNFTCPEGGSDFTPFAP